MYKSFILHCSDPELKAGAQVRAHSLSLIRKLSVSVRVSIEEKEMRVLALTLTLTLFQYPEPAGCRAGG